MAASRGAALPRTSYFIIIGKADYMWIRDMPLTASEREQTITLHPRLVIRGRVTDAKTGRPSPRFRVVQGFQPEWQNQIHWSENEGVENTNGQYTVQFDEPRKGLLVKIEAPGYKPAVSRAFLPDEGSQIFDVALASRGRHLGRCSASRRPAGCGSRGRGVRGAERCAIAIGPVRSQCEFPEGIDGHRRTVLVPRAVWPVPADRSRRCRLCRCDVRGIREVGQARSSNRGDGSRAACGSVPGTGRPRR